MNKYVIGIDGGGTKSAVTVADLDGVVLEKFRSGAINPNGEKLQNVNANLADIFAHMNSLEDCAAVCIGAAGISNPSVKRIFLSAASDAGYHGNISIMGDHQTAFYGALGKPVGIILISGTGSICYGKNILGQEHRTGGYGHLIDDEGSGYAVGRDILSAVVQAFDGRGEKSVLTELVFHQLNCSNIEELIGFVYDKSTNKRDIAALAPNLTLACVQHDKAAEAIVKKCASGLERMVEPVAEKLELQNKNLSIAGSVLLKDEYIRQAFLQKIQARYPDLNCHTPKYDPAYGAVLIALESL